MRQRNMTVVGIYDLGLSEAEKGSVYINLPVAQRLYNLRDQDTEVAVLLEKVGTEEALVAELQPALPGYELNTWFTLQPEIQSTMNTERTVLGVFGLVIILIASIGILNLMMMAVYERTREMGVLTALGMKGRELLAVFVIEGAIIGAIGAVLGSALGWLAVQAIRMQGGLNLLALYGEDVLDSFGGEFMALMGETLVPATTPQMLLTWGLGVVFVAALASLIPALGAARREPAEALHHI